MWARSLIAGLCLVSAGCVAPQAGTTDAPAATAGQGIAHPQQWPTDSSPAAITDSATEARINALMARMTLEQKIGQLIQADISTITPQDLARYPLGAILAGGNSDPHGDERASAAKWDELVESFVAQSRKPAANGVAIPIMFGIDAVHGHNNVPGATIFPQNIGLGAAHDPALIRRIGAATAAEVAGTGIDWAFAPTLAVPQDLRWGRSYEGYSADPALVRSYAEEMVLGLQGQLQSGKSLGPDHVAATAKHFLADGGTAGGQDQGDARISEEQLRDVHAQGYYGAVKAGTLTVMASFSSWNGVKNHGNKSLLTGVLKQRMGFKGFIVGDWNGHGQVPGCTTTDCPAALEAGLDMFMAPDGWKELFASTLREARDGTIPMARINDAVRRILRVKFKLGLFDHPPVLRRDLDAVGAAAHLALAREAVAKSLVLLKNNGSVLPVRPGARVLVAGRSADSLAMQSGGWTISWQGNDVTNGDFPNGQTVQQAIGTAVRAAGGSMTYSPDGSFTQRPDVAIVVYGESPYAEFQGDIPNLAYRPGDTTDLDLLKKLRGEGIPVVSVFLSGRPLFVSPEINASDAFVAAWLPGTQVNGIADVLIDRANGRPARDFTGTLSFPWPADARSPITRPLFPMGYGLDYAHPRETGHLSEDPHADLSAATDVNSLYAAGRTPAPWSMQLSDPQGIVAADSGEVATASGALAMHPADVRAQEDARSFTWTGPAAFAITGAGADLSRQLNNSFVLHIDWRIDSPPQGRVTFAIGSARLDVTAIVRAEPPGKLDTLYIPLRCFADAGADLGHLRNALTVSSSGPFAATLVQARYEATGQDYACPPVAH